MPRPIPDTRRGRAVKSVFRATFVGSLIFFGWNLQSLFDVVLDYVIDKPVRWPFVLLLLLLAVQAVLVAGISYRGFRRNLLPTEFSAGVLVVLMAGIVFLQRMVL